jgi:hypothetical protein
MRSHGDTNVTVGAGSLPNVGAMTTNAAKANNAGFPAVAYTTLSLPRESNFDIAAAQSFGLASRRTSR